MSSDLVRKGLSIISQCKDDTGDIWHAHFGAAAIASYYLVKDFTFSQESVDRIISQSEKMIEKHSLSQVHFTTGVDYTVAERKIVDALEETIGQLHWVGHHVIYTAYSLLAIRELGSWGEESIDKIVQLILSFKGTIPGRSWIGYTAKDIKNMEITKDDKIPSILTPVDLSEFILKELATFQTIYEAEAHHDLIGHMLTYSHALNVIYDLGHHSLFHKGLFPVLQLVKALRKSKEITDVTSIKLVSPVDKLPLFQKQRANALPFEKSFWEKDYEGIEWDFGHLFKFTYSYLDHTNRVPALKEDTLENFRYIISY
ncbi:hypothetical protein [Bacillus alkalicellulosilyticus]|uniref:hypothetical protein n=1 Tax=Alkalihalobacterium alkalicellulosilyticum TaxID=1912214 RepID=UPI000997B921|nr:hypothetical protein [Bacillus alkalicellulosilyticus]